MRRLPWSLAVGMILSMGFFAYAWSGAHSFVAPILAGGYFVEVLNRVIRFPVWLNQALFFVVNGVVLGAVVFIVWSGAAKVLIRGTGREQPGTSVTD
jgi:hypothetical protein